MDLIPDADADAYWRSHCREGPSLKPLGKPCHDCAVVDGFYEGFTRSLATQPQEIIDRVAERWFCHNHRNRACAGNIALLRVLTEHPTAQGSAGTSRNAPGDREAGDAASNAERSNP